MVAAAGRVGAVIVEPFGFTDCIIKHLVLLGGTHSMLSVLQGVRRELLMACSFRGDGATISLCGDVGPESAAYFGSHGFFPRTHVLIPTKAVSVAHACVVLLCTLCYRCL
jgi:hypothetical protein